MPRMIVIGYGNPLRGDDAIGWLAAQKLSEKFQDPQITIIASHQLTPEMSLSLSEHEKALFLDSKAGARVGRIQARSIHLKKDTPVGTFSHEVSPEGLLAQSKLLYGKAPKAFICTMECEDFELKEGLSAKAEDNFQRYLKAAEEVIFQK